MKTYLTGFLLLFCFLAKGAHLDENPADTATIRLLISARNSIRFTYYDDFLVQRDLIFRNTAQHDSIVVKKIYAKNITELRYSLMNLETKESYFNLLFIKGGDQIDIALENLKLKNLSQNPYLFVSDHLTIDDSVFAIQQANAGLNEMIKANQSIYNTNLRKIDSLLQSKQITDSIANLWREVAHNFYGLKLIRMRYTKGPYLDTLVNNLKQGLLKEQKINSSFLCSAVYAIGNYNKVQHGLNQNLKYFIEEVIKIKTAERYKFGVIFQELNRFPEKTSEFYLACYKLFDQQLKDDVFRNQSYFNKINPAQVAFDKNTVKLVSYQQHALTLADVFRKHKGKIIVFDFWASWCIPCINEFPALEKAKGSLSNKDIVFVTISLDKDLKEKDWKAMLVNMKIGKENQFRVLERTNKLISNLYKIESIPRYLIFDKSGVLINDNFVKPSDPTFEKKLLAYDN